MQIKLAPVIICINRMGDIAAAVNTILGASSTATTSDTGEITDAEMFAAFVAAGMTKAGAAGLMGNLYAESRLKSNNLQNTGNTALGMTDDEFTAAMDAGSYSNFVKDGYGYGLAQWTYYTRKQALLDFMKASGVSIGHKKKQVEFLISEIKGYSAVWKVLTSATTVKEASDIVLAKYEAPADQSDSVKTKRAGYGQTYYDKYAESGSASTGTVTTFPACPFTVKVLISDLNYRSEGSMNGTVKGQTGKGIFTITEINSAGWGKLKSGAGWIYLGNPDYCTVQGTTATFTPYTVRVKVSDLNIRKDATIDAASVGYTGKGTFTIVEEKTGKINKSGSTGTWGKLKSGAGWICLAFSDYTTKV